MSALLRRLRTPFVRQFGTGHGHDHGHSSANGRSLEAIGKAWCDRFPAKPIPAMAPKSTTSHLPVNPLRPTYTHKDIPDMHLYRRYHDEFLHARTMDAIYSRTELTPKIVFECFIVYALIPYALYEFIVSESKKKDMENYGFERLYFPESIEQRAVDPFIGDRGFREDAAYAPKD
eukprot:TRINITY_DN14799_c0_g1::TRINITY_DN14799_c0_g1_i1::g.30240::m.30240 TRINITY_DN14799_c0_g1::TRINITY_DN14799_c0_g1_i1::g.30240  ORF type:complete len:188 (+),score=16.14 TRINITY_DN14799_c0_g1_i1:42-566(+)